MIRSNTSSPTVNRENRRELPSRSAALGGSGPDAMKAKFLMGVAWKVSGGAQAPVR